MYGGAMTTDHGGPGDPGASRLYFSISFSTYIRLGQDPVIMSWTVDGENHYETESLSPSRGR